MCFFDSPSPLAPPPQPAPMPVTPPPASPAPAAPALNPGEDGSNKQRKDNKYLTSMRGRNSLRIDMTQPTTGTSGTGLNIPA